MLNCFISILKMVMFTFVSLTFQAVNISWLDTGCDEGLSIITAYDLGKDQNVEVIIGPACSKCKYYLYHRAGFQNQGYTLISNLNKCWTIVNNSLCCSHKYKWWFCTMQFRIIRIIKYIHISEVSLWCKRKIKRTLS